MSPASSPPAPETDRERAPRAWIDWGIAAGCGLLMAATLPVVLPIVSREEILPSGWLEPLALVGLVPLLARLRSATPRRAFCLGTLSGGAYFLLALYWLNTAMTVFGHMPEVLSFPVLLLLVGFLSLFWGFSLWGAVRLRDRLGLGLHLGLPACWVTLEFVRNYLFTGFPWANLGYTQLRSLWLAQLGSLGGVYLVAFTVVLTNGVGEALWSWWRGKAPLPRWGVVSWAGLLALGNIYSAFRLSGASTPEAAERLRVAVVQGNLDEKAHLRGPGDQRWVFSRMLQASRAAVDQGATLLVWPEGTLPDPVGPQIASFAPAAAGASDEARIPAEAILGAVTRAEKGDGVILTNSAFLVDGELKVQGRYDKRHLVPFGEYLPLASLLPHRWFVPEGVAFFVPGPDHRPRRARAGRLGVLICYEAIFPEIARETVRRGAQLLVNITNDSWYGFSSAATQHLAISRMRAIETGRYLVRAANTGVSAIIDPVGRELGRIPLGLVPTDRDRAARNELVAPAALVRTVALLDGLTVYLMVGDLFAWVCGLAAVGLLGWSLVRPRLGRRQ